MLFLQDVYFKCKSHFNEYKHFTFLSPIGIHHLLRKLIKGEKSQVIKTENLVEIQFKFIILEDSI